MTETPDSRHLDEMASAFLDGEATADERARIEADPLLQQRVSELREASGATGSEPTPAAPAARAAHLASALDAFDELFPAADAPAITVPPTTESATVIDLADRPSRSRGRWLAAAASVLVVAGGIGFVANLDSGSDDSADVATGAFATTTAPAAGLVESDALADGEGADMASASDDAAVETTMAQESEMAEEAGDESADDGAAAPQAPIEALQGQTVEELVALVPVPLPFDQSTCGIGPEVTTLRSIQGPSLDAAPLGYAPVVVEGEEGELLLFVTADGEVVGLVVDSACELLLE